MKKYQVTINFPESTVSTVKTFDPRDYKWNSILDARVDAVRYLSLRTEYYEKNRIAADVSLRIID